MAGITPTFLRRVAAPLLAATVVLVPAAVARGADSSDGVLRRALVVSPAPFSASAAPKRLSSLLVRIPRSLAITTRPGGGRRVGVMPSGSKYLGTPTTAWIQEVSRNGRFGLATVPYRAGGARGWIALAGLSRSTTRYEVRIDLSKHRLDVLRFGRVILRVSAGTGAPWSPTPPGRYFVTDRVPVRVGSPFGSFAFGLSGIQTNLPPGWTGGNQLAIHGTNRPSTIGASASAGCIHVSEAMLARLRPILVLGTPVVIER